MAGPKLDRRVLTAAVLGAAAAVPAFFAATFAGTVAAAVLGVMSGVFWVASGIDYIKGKKNEDQTKEQDELQKGQEQELEQSQSKGKFKFNAVVIAAGVLGAVAAAATLFSGFGALVAVGVAGMTSGTLWTASAFYKKNVPIPQNDPTQSQSSENSRPPTRERFGSISESRAAENTKTTIGVDKVILAAGITSVVAAMGVFFGGLAAIMTVGGVGLVSGVFWAASAKSETVSATVVPHNEFARDADSVAQSADKALEGFLSSKSSVISDDSVSVADRESIADMEELTQELRAMAGTFDEVVSKDMSGRRVDFPPTQARSAANIANKQDQSMNKD